MVLKSYLITYFDPKTKNVSSTFIKAENKKKAFDIIKTRKLIPISN
jgi:hypothetical protein